MKAKVDRDSIVSTKARGKCEYIVQSYSTHIYFTGYPRTSIAIAAAHAKGPELELFRGLPGRVSE